MPAPRSWSRTDTTITFESAKTGELVTIDLPTPPPLRVVQKGLFRDVETRVSLADLQKAQAQDR